MTIPYKDRLEYFKEYYIKHKNHIDSSHFLYRQKLKDKVYVLLGGYQCSICGFDDPRALQIDHINGGGVKEKKSTDDCKYLLSIIRNNGVGFQILCANCNWIKRDVNCEYHKSIHRSVKANNMDL